jgi:hypothetical protein
VLLVRLLMKLQEISTLMSQGAGELSARPCCDEYRRCHRPVKEVCSREFGTRELN